VRSLFILNKRKELDHTLLNKSLDDKLIVIQSRYKAPSDKIVF